MRFKIKRLDRNKHSDIVSCIGWSNGGELFSVSDDNTVLKWDINGEHDSKIMDIDVPVIDMDWLPSGKGANEIVALACNDGSFKLVSKAGRVEKSISEAHASAIISIRWSYDGAALATAGEDGQIKIWSRGGMLRSAVV
jgi:intraflagellar transport protein 80